MRRTWIVVAIFAIAIAAVPNAAPARAHAAPAPTSVFDALGSCFSSRRHLLLAFVIDESASLGDAAQHRPGTDPSAQRVAAAQIAVDGIENLAAQGTRVDVLLSGFSDDLHEYGTWQSLDATTRPSIEQQLDGFRTRDTGVDTDFYNAIAGVQRELAQRAAASGDDPCELVLLFTDGRFDIDSRVAKPYDTNGDDPKDVKAARGIAAMCAPGGPMQRLRDDGAHTVTLALADASSPGSGQPDRAFLDRLASGDCATPGSQYGASFDAANAPLLVGEFDTIASRVRAGVALPGDCAHASARVDTGPALRAVHVFADLGAPRGELVITPPQGRPLRIPSTGVFSSGGITARATVVRERFVAVEVAPSAAWSGALTAAVEQGGQGARCQVFVFGNWHAQLDATSLRRGETATLTFAIVDSTGHSVPEAELPSSASVTATIEDPASRQLPVALRVVHARGGFEAAYTLPSTFSGGAVVVTSTLHVTVDGLDLTSGPRPVELAVAQHAGLPSVSPARLRMTNVVGTGVARAVLRVAGDPTRAGRVCITGIDWLATPPVPVTDLETTPVGTCARVGPNGRAELPFTVSVRTLGYGRVSGEVRLVVSGAGTPATIVEPFAFSISAPVNAATRNLVFVALFAAALLVPLGLLWAMSRQAAVFRQPAGLRAARVDVRVYPDGTVRRFDGDGVAVPLELRPSDFVDAHVTEGRTRAFAWRDLEFAARWSWNPFAAPHGEVHTDGAHVAASEGTLRGRRRTTNGRVALTLPGTWIFTLGPPVDDPGTRVVEGTVTAFVLADASFDYQAERIVESVRGFFGRVAQRLTARVREPGDKGR